MDRSSFALAGATALCVASLLLLDPRSAWSWGCQGHRIVAYIARAHLGPNAKAQVKKLLSENPIDPSLKRFCKPRAPDPFVDGSTWADDVRESRSDTSEWHFLDIPRGAAQAEVPSFCPDEGCVTTAITDQLAILKSETGTSDAERAEALRFVVHFVGDIHQPLHCTTNGDRGGNCVPVEYLDSKPKLSKGKYTPNLHQVWDTRVIQTELTERDMWTSTLADDIDERFATQIEQWMQETPDLNGWAWDGHQIAEVSVYGTLSPTVPEISTTPQVKSCSTGNVNGKMLALGLEIDEDDQKAALPIVEQQLAKAGARLAEALNRVWP